MRGEQERLRNAWAWRVRKGAVEFDCRGLSMGMAARDWRIPLAPRAGPALGEGRGVAGDAPVGVHSAALDSGDTDAETGSYATREPLENGLFQCSARLLRRLDDDSDCNGGASSKPGGSQRPYDARC